MWLRKKTIVEKVIGQSDKLDPELRELVLGRKTVISLLSFGIGTVLIGNAFWRFFSSLLGEWITGCIGFALFIIGGLMQHEFKKR